MFKWIDRSLDVMMYVSIFTLLRLCHGPIPGAIIFEKPAKRHKTLVKNYENSTELLIFAELLTYKSLKLLHDWLLWSSNFSPFIYKPTQQIEDKQVPKYDFQ